MKMSQYLLMPAGLCLAASISAPSIAQERVGDGALGRSRAPWFWARSVFLRAVSSAIRQALE